MTGLVLRRTFAGDNAGIAFGNLTETVFDGRKIRRPDEKGTEERMDSDFRATWGSEQWVIDRLVESVHLGDADQKLRCATAFLTATSIASGVGGGWQIQGLSFPARISTHRLLTLTRCATRSVTTTVRERRSVFAKC